MHVLHTWFVHVVVIRTCSCVPFVLKLYSTSQKSGFQVATLDDVWKNAESLYAFIEAKGVIFKILRYKKIEILNTSFGE